MADRSVEWSDTHDVGSRDVAAEPSPVQAGQWAARVCSRRGLEPTARPTQDVSCIRQAARTLFTGPVSSNPRANRYSLVRLRNAKRALSGIARVSRWPKVGSTRVAGRPGSRTVQTPPGAASRPRSGSLPGRVRRAPRREIAAAMLIARWLVEAVAWRGAALVRGRRRSRRPASWRW